MLTCKREREREVNCRSLPFRRFPVLVYVPEGHAKPGWSLSFAHCPSDAGETKPCRDARSFTAGEIKRRQIWKIPSDKFGKSVGSSSRVHSTLNERAPSAEHFRSSSKVSKLPIRPERQELESATEASTEEVDKIEGFVREGRKHVGRNRSSYPRAKRKKNLGWM